MIVSTPLRVAEPLPTRHGCAQTYFELLQTIAAMTGELGRGPMQKELAAAYTVSKQRIFQRMEVLVRCGLVDTVRPVVTLSHNAKLLLETGLDATLKE